MGALLQYVNVIESWLAMKDIQTKSCDFTFDRRRKFIDWDIRGADENRPEVIRIRTGVKIESRILITTTTLPIRDNGSVADPGCLSRIPDLGSRIPKQQQKRGVRKKLLSYLFL